MSLESQLKKKINDSVVPEATEGLQILVRKRGKVICHLSVGQTYDFYDLASLTKIIFTNTLLMDLVSKQKIELDHSIEDILPWASLRNITLKHLLTHTAGFHWWRPYYKTIDTHQEIVTRWEVLKSLLSKEKTKKNSPSVYSDLDYFILAFYLERVLEKPLANIWTDFSNSMELGDLHFNLSNRPQFARSKYAPTERCPWRKRLLRGEVHDDNTWALGGLSTHAGLFGSIHDVDLWFSHLRKHYNSSSKHGQVVRKFFRRAIAPSKGDWTMGFMMPAREGSSAGRYFSKSSIGHTGFTGTSFWFDPIKDLSVIILSNRVHPTRENNKFVKLRPLIHDWIQEGM